MNAPSVDIKDMLEDDASLGLTFNTDLFVGREPTKPNNTVTIFDTPGSPPDLTFNKAEQYFRPSISIRVRNDNYQDGWNLINNIKVSLHGRGQETVNDTFYSVLVCSNEPFLFDWDDNGRARFVANFDIQRR